PPLSFGQSARRQSFHWLSYQRIREEFQEKKIVWAYTSEIVRQKMGLPSLQQAFATIEAEGYRKAIVQPLHIFPATEYNELSELCYKYPNIRVVMGETLLHRWQFVHEVLKIVEADFLPVGEGVNLLVAHGTPMCADPANIIYQGLYTYLPQKYENVFLATVDGMPDREVALKNLPRAKRVRLLPFMYLAGIHVEKDLLGPSASFKTALEALGFETDWPVVTNGNERLVKALGLYDEVWQCFVERIKRALTLMQYF
ncbi:MAG: sirohydrochlorin cobaltochelatase, partial [Candidatus Magnetoovum sp. WYHC-5]|nr:sirohydrochlorin cobaltochelatase [Candidatus Magnetoovum sp. WYHC-5]